MIDLAELENKKHEMFCREYALTGLATPSYAKVYGCKTETAEVSSCRLLSNVKVINRIKELGTAVLSDKIANIVEVKEFWTETMRNRSNEIKDRLKASEMIAKSCGAFLEKLEITAPKVIFINDDNIED